MKANKVDSTNKKILDAAEQLFAEKSYEGTTLREIAKKVGIREPSIYAHFSNKEAIYGAVIDRALSLFYQEISAWGSAELSLNQLLEIPRRLLSLHALHPYSAKILHKEFTSPPDRISPQFVSGLEQTTELVQVFLSGLPHNEYSQASKKDAVLLIIALSNVALGFFSSQGLQSKLLGDEVGESEVFEAHNKIVYKIFKSMLL